MSRCSPELWGVQRGPKHEYVWIEMQASGTAACSRRNVRSLAHYSADKGYGGTRRPAAGMPSVRFPALNQAGQMTALGREQPVAPSDSSRSSGAQRSIASERTGQHVRRPVCLGFRRLVTAVRREQTLRCAAWRPRAAVGYHYLDGAVRLLRSHCCRPRKELRVRGVRKASGPHLNDCPGLA